MSPQHPEGWTRRRFLGGLTVAGTVGFLGLHPRGITAEPPPETTTLKLAQTTSLCQAPQYIAEALLHGEGFTEVRYVTDARQDYARALATGEVDLTMIFVGPLLLRLDEGAPVILLGGGHIGCLELFVTERIRTIRDLKGKTAAVTAQGSAPHVFLASIMAYIGLDPRKDIHPVTHAPDEAVRLLEAGKVDVYITSPPGPRNSGPSRSDVSSSTAVRIARGRNTFAARWPGTRRSSERTRWRPSERCARS
jgi:NitT/TauT family transport system substrate-binding protein